MRAIGTLIAMANMPAQRRYSREYLSTVFGRPPRFREVFNHFFNDPGEMIFALKDAAATPAAIALQLVRIADPLPHHVYLLVGVAAELTALEIRDADMEGAEQDGPAGFQPAAEIVCARAVDCAMREAVDDP